MKHIFLDFDRTLFNTEAFYNLLELTHIEGIVQSMLGSDFSLFLYADAVGFMCNSQNAGYICHLVTFGRKSVQECKVNLSGCSKYFTKMFYVEQGSKASAIGPFIKTLKATDDLYFVDDSHEHLREMSIKIPKMSLFHMKRPGAKGSEQQESPFRIVQNLAEVFVEVSYETLK